ncbi:hypothetical protein C9374_000372, partial [Naegleria lovaniensis]
MKQQGRPSIISLEDLDCQSFGGLFIHLLSEAIQYSENNISQFGIPRDHTNNASKTSQAIQQCFSHGEELDSLIAFTNTASTIPTIIKRLGQHCLAYGHEVYTWGENSKGEVGDGTIEPRVVPLKVCSWDLQGPKMVEQVAAAPYVFYAIDQFGKLYAWGKNNRGQLGDRTTIDKNKPINVYMEGALLNKAVTLVCGGDLHTVVLTTDNQLYSFGDNQYGQLGLGYESAADYIMEAVPIPNLLNLVMKPLLIYNAEITT